MSQADANTEEEKRKMASVARSLQSVSHSAGLDRMLGQLRAFLLVQGECMAARRKRLSEGDGVGAFLLGVRKLPM